MPLRSKQWLPNINSFHSPRGDIVSASVPVLIVSNTAPVLNPSPKGSRQGLIALIALMPWHGAGAVVFTNTTALAQGRSL